MAIYGFNVLKRAAYRGGVQHFGNTYYYEVTTTDDDVTGLERVLDEIVSIEKAFHSTDVTYVQGRVWSAGGTAAQNTMLVEKQLTGTGNRGPDPNMDRERAILIQFRAGVDSRGRPVYLRKWFHIMGTFWQGTASDGVKAQTAQIPTIERDQFRGEAERLEVIDLIDAPRAELRSKSGRQVTGATAVHPFLEHRQLGEEWRGG